jgi:hypothetical protein
MKISQLRQLIREEIQNSTKPDFNGFWKEHDEWAVTNKHPSWRKQKDNMVRISPSFGITLSSSDWNNIFNMYGALFKKFYFIGGWDEQVKPWFEKQIMKYQK